MSENNSSTSGLGAPDIPRPAELTGESVVAADDEVVCRGPASLNLLARDEICLIASLERG